MAKRDNLAMINVLMRRIKQDDVTTIDVTGHASAVLKYLEDAEREITNHLNGRWYTLLTNRTFRTSENVIVTVLDYTSLSSKTITITYNGVDVVLTEGVEWTASVNNDTTATSIASAITTALSGVTGTAVLAVVTARTTTPINNTGMSAVVTSASTSDLTVALDANGEYALPTNYHSTLIIKNTSQNIIIYPDVSKVLDFDDPDESTTGTTLVYSVEGSVYRFHPRPSSVDIIKEKYWRMPVGITVATDEYELPDICEVAILTLAESNLWYYLDKSLKGDRLRILYNKELLPSAVTSNDNILDRILMLEADHFSSGNPSGLPLAPPFLGSNFPR